MKWHAIKKEEVIKHLKSDSCGLSSKEAEERLRQFGKNEIKEVYKVHPFKIFLKQFKSFLVYVLLLAIAISFLIKHYIDGSVIAAIVILNASLGFIQQYKTEKSILQLRQMFIPQAKVFRDKKLKIISSQDIVPGDVILFEEGDKILADCRIIETEVVEVNEAVLTGESNSIEKYDTLVREDGIITDRINMLYAGTILVKGKVKAVVVSTGMATEFGRIALKLQEIALPETPMQKKLDKFARQISLIIFIIVAVTFFLGIAQGKEKIEMFLTSIALFVSAIPEGLPAIITISLAYATKRMLKNNVLIRRLSAAETLGSVTIICSDKTGTMTEEKMSVVTAFCNNKFYKVQEKGIFLKNKKIGIDDDKELYTLIKTSILSSNARFEQVDRSKEYTIIGDPTESAFVSLALDAGINKKFLTEQEPRIREIAFSSERRMMSILRKVERGNVVYCKGSPSMVIEKSFFEYKDNGLFSLSERRKEELLKTAEFLEKKGLRVMAFAYKFTHSDKYPEEGLTFAGLMALLDPPRPEVKPAIELCKQAGIKVKMITGDSMLTAKTIGEEIGITGKVVGGRELEEMSDEELIEQIDEIAIFARISPSQKLRIVEILEKKGEEIAITGDGINDILALKKADIGVAMGKRGSDVARDVSDMILLDDNFASILKGIEEGRVVYDNSKKATKFLLASNFDEILLIAYSILFSLPLPILPIQILWVNLASDAFPALALSRENPENVMKTKPRKEASLLNDIFLFVMIAGIISVASSLLIFHYGLGNLSIEKTRTMVMFTTIGFEVFFVFSCRSNKPIHKIGYFSNKYILYAVGAMIAMQAILVFTPLAGYFSIVSLTGKEWLFVLAASVPGLIFFEGAKYFKLWDKIKIRKKGAGTDGKKGEEDEGE